MQVKRKTSSYWGILGLIALLALTACSSEPVRLIPPSGPEPQSVFVFERDYNTVWNSLLRALEQMPGAEVWSHTKEEGKISLREARVPVSDNCRCGWMGDRELTGTVNRFIAISVGEEAPQLTRVRIQCQYAMPFSWPNVYGRNASEQTIECVSSGRFENELHQRTLQFLSR